VMVPHGAKPAFLGTHSGDDDIKPATMTKVTLHWQEGGNVVLSEEAHAERGQESAAARQAAVLWH